MANKSDTELVESTYNIDPLSLNYEDSFESYDKDLQTKLEQEMLSAVKNGEAALNNFLPYDINQDTTAKSLSTHDFKLLNPYLTQNKEGLWEYNFSGLAIENMSSFLANIIAVLFKLLNLSTEVLPIIHFDKDKKSQDASVKPIEFKDRSYVIRLSLSDFKKLMKEMDFYFSSISLIKDKSKQKKLQELFIKEFIRTRFVRIIAHEVFHIAQSQHVKNKPEYIHSSDNYEGYYNQWEERTARLFESKFETEYFKNLKNLL